MAKIRAQVGEVWIEGDAIGVGELRAKVSAALRAAAQLGGPAGETVAAARPAPAALAAALRLDPNLAAELAAAPTPAALGRAVIAAIRRCAERVPADIAAAALAGAEAARLEALAGRPGGGRDPEARARLLARLRVPHTVRPTLVLEVDPSARAAAPAEHSLGGLPGVRLAGGDLGPRGLSLALPGRSELEVVAVAFRLCTPAARPGPLRAPGVGPSGEPGPVAVSVDGEAVAWGELAPAEATAIAAEAEGGALGDAARATVERAAYDFDRACRGPKKRRPPEGAPGFVALPVLGEAGPGPLDAWAAGITSARDEAFRAPGELAHLGQISRGERPEGITAAHAREWPAEEWDLARPIAARLLAAGPRDPELGALREAVALRPAPALAAWVRVLSLAAAPPVAAEPPPIPADTLGAGRAKRTRQR